MQLHATSLIAFWQKEFLYAGFGAFGVRILWRM